MIRPNLLCLDLETTGLGERGERVVPVQLAAIVLDPDLNELATFNTFLKIPSYAHIEPYAMEMHAKKGRTFDWFQENGQTPMQAYQDFARFCKPYGRLLPMGHNAAKFDMPILVRELLLNGIAVDTRRAEKYQYVIDLDYHVLDTAGLAYASMVFKHQEVSKVSLKPLCDYLEIRLPEEDAHDALNDIRATVEVFRYLMAERLK